MESFSKKYKIIPFMLIFMTPLVSILYNVLKLVPEIKKMTAPYAPVFSLLFNLLWVIFTISLIKMMIQVWENVHDSYQLVLAQKARDMLLVQEKEVEQFQKNIVKRQEEVYKTLKSVYLIATRDLSNLWLQFFLSQNQGFMRLFEKTVLK